MGAVVAVFFTLVLVWASAQAAGSSIEAHFRVQAVGETLRLRAVVTGLPAEGIYLTFASPGGRHLEDRIGGMSATSPGGVASLAAVAPGVYFLQPPPAEPVEVTYDLLTRFPGWDQNYPSVTADHWYIPVAYTLFTLHQGSPSGPALAGRVTMQLEGMPAHWQLLTTCPREGNTVTIDEPEALVFAGDYHSRDFHINDRSFHISVNKALPELNARLFAQLPAVLAAQYRLFGAYKEHDALVVVNPLPEFARQLEAGGQAKPGSAVLFVRAGRPVDDEQVTRYLEWLAHETFHLWLTQSFRTKETMYWFTEGMARYQEYRLLNELNLISRSELERALARELLTAIRLQRREPVSLLVAGKSLVGDPERRDLNYSKGALVAYMLDEQLRRQNVPGRSLADLLATLYRDYALSGEPLGNAEIIGLINDFTGDNQFADRWIVQATAIRPSDLPQLSAHLRWVWMAMLPGWVADVLENALRARLLALALVVSTACLAAWARRRRRA